MNSADQADFVGAADNDGLGSVARSVGERVERDAPASVSVGDGGLGLLGDIDDYSLTGGGGAPDRHRPLSLQDHVVGKDARKLDVGESWCGAKDDREQSRVESRSHVGWKREGT